MVALPSGKGTVPKVDRKTKPIPRAGSGTVTGVGAGIGLHSAQSKTFTVTCPLTAVGLTRRRSWTCGA